jgi:hypothetical protein
MGPKIAPPPPPTCYWLAESCCRRLTIIVGVPVSVPTDFKIHLAGVSAGGWRFARGQARAQCRHRAVCLCRFRCRAPCVSTFGVVGGRAAMPAREGACTDGPALPLCVLAERTSRIAWGRRCSRAISPRFQTQHRVWCCAAGLRQWPGTSRLAFSQRTCVADCCSNSFRVVKTVKQTAPEPVSYTEAISGILKTDGVQVRMPCLAGHCRSPCTTAASLLLALSQVS